MRRADRLFRIVQILRRRRSMTAAALAERLEVSERTIYRDIADLTASGTPIVGEAGAGYRMDRAFELPPLTFTVDELDALALGMRMVERWGDGDLRAAARSILDKVDAVMPERERQRLAGTALFALSFGVPEETLERLKSMRLAAGDRHHVAIDYLDGDGRATRRVIRPLGLFFWGQVWTVGAYCELRQDFRNFRLDRIGQLTVKKTKFEHISPCTLEDYMNAMRCETQREA